VLQVEAREIGGGGEDSVDVMLKEYPKSDK
jgi:hypothetical protein